MDEIWQSASIVEAHSWAVRIEDAHDMSVHIVIAVVGHGHRFRKTFCFVVYASRTNGIYVAPILFVLARFLGRHNTRWSKPGKISPSSQAQARARCACRGRPP